MNAESLLGFSERSCVTKLIIKLTNLIIKKFKNIF